MFLHGSEARGQACWYDANTPEDLPGTMKVKHCWATMGDDNKPVLEEPGPGPVHFIKMGPEPKQRQ